MSKVFLSIDDKELVMSTSSIWDNSEATIFS